MAADAANSSCEEALPTCEPFAPRHGRWGVAALVNPTYRIKDLLYQHGDRWRYDAVRIMCNPRYRGTALRRILYRTSTVSGLRSTLPGSPDAQRERHVQSLSDVDAYGRRQPRGVFRLRGATPPRAAINLSNLPRQLHAFRQALRGARCKAFGHSSLVVVLRAGDVAWATRSAAANLQAISPGLVARAVDYLQAQPRIVHLRIFTVMHFGGKALDGTGGFEKLPATINASLLMLDAFIAQVQGRMRAAGRRPLRVHVHSNVAVDDDVCAFAPRRGRGRSWALSTRAAAPGRPECRVIPWVPL